MPYSVCRNLKAIFEKAINQLTTITIHNEADLNFKCPYHANIINTFEAVSKTIGKKYFILKNKGAILQLIMRRSRKNSAFHKNNLRPQLKRRKKRQCGLTAPADKKLKPLKNAYSQAIIILIKSSNPRKEKLQPFAYYNRFIAIPR